MLHICQKTDLAKHNQQHKKAAGFVEIVNPDQLVPLNSISGDIFWSPKGQVEKSVTYNPVDPSRHCTNVINLWEKGWQKPFSRCLCLLTPQRSESLPQGLPSTAALPGMYLDFFVHCALSHFSGVWLCDSMGYVVTAPPLSMKPSGTGVGLPPPLRNFPNPGIRSCISYAPCYTARQFLPLPIRTVDLNSGRAGCALVLKDWHTHQPIFWVFPSRFILQRRWPKTSFSISFWMCFFGLSYGYKVIKSLQISCQVSAGTSLMIILATLSSSLLDSGGISQKGCKIYNLLQDLELLPKGQQRKKNLTTCMAQGGRKQSQGPRM